jgi:hypothetical protein
MTHKHEFDSCFGFVPEAPAVMCYCGAWAMPSFGEWQVVPKELLPSACTYFMKRRRRVEIGFLAAAAVILLLETWFL